MNHPWDIIKTSVPFWNRITYFISARLAFLAGASIFLVLLLAVLNWTALGKLNDLHEEALSRSSDAGQIKHDASLGAAKTRWDLDAALMHAAKVADTPDEKKWAEEMTLAMNNLREAYQKEYAACWVC